MHKILVGKPRDNSPGGRSRLSRCLENNESWSWRNRLEGVDLSVLTHNKNQLAGLCGFSGKFLGRLRDLIASRVGFKSVEWTKNCSHGTVKQVIWGRYAVVVRTDQDSYEDLTGVYTV